MNNNGDDALRYFFALQENVKAKILAARNIAAGAAQTFIGRTFYYGRYLNTNPALYDAYLTKFRSQSNGASLPIEEYTERRRLGYGILLLVHPTKPDPDPLLRCFRDIEGDQDSRFLRPKSSIEAHWQLKCAQNLITVLQQQNRPDDVRWTSAFLNKLRKTLKMKLRLSSPQGQ